ncbi:MAG TPA: DUF1236 domain-containing protein [Pseudolabrys sp.]|nr:DUF1236 domain-containing protein [Pseudolabrys sp.]
MRKTHLLTTVAASLLLATAATAADNANQKGKSELANPAPTAQQGAPAEKVAPSMNAGQKRPETTGQAAKPDTASEPKVGDSGRAGMKASEKSEMKAGDKHETTGQSSGASGKAQINESKEKAGVNDKAETKSGAAVKSETKSGASQQSSQSVNGKASTTGQGAAAGAGANLSTEQRTKITTILKQHKVEPAKLNISVHVGARVPETVHFYPLPTEVVEIYPEWRGFDYILVGDEIIVVNPRTHLIVAVLEA